MIEVKAEARENESKEKGVAVSCQCQGHATSIIDESIAVIRAIMESLKEVDKTLHLIVIKEICKNPGILTGEDSKEKIKEIQKISKNTKMTSMN